MLLPAQPSGFIMSLDFSLSTFCTRHLLRLFFVFLFSSFSVNFFTLLFHSQSVVLKIFSDDVITL